MERGGGVGAGEFLGVVVVEGAGFVGGLRRLGELRFTKFVR